MDNIFEILVPLLIAAVYFFGNMFSGKSKEDEGAPPLQPRERDADDDEAADALERQRRIQEEIRRKIMERRQASGGGPPQLAPAEAAPMEGRRDLSGQGEVQKRTPEPVHQSRNQPPPIREARPGAYSWDTSEASGAAYDSQMQAQLKRIEATKRQAQKLQKEAAARPDIDKTSHKPNRRSGGYFSGTVRESLRDPQAARVAFIYGEVLGPPVSLRKGSSSVPGFS